MHFNKYPYFGNFEFSPSIANRTFRTAKGSYQLKVREGADDIFHLKISGGGWKNNHSAADLHFPKAGRKSGNSCKLAIDKTGRIRLLDANDRELLSSLPGRGFGQCGKSSVFEFIRNEDDHFYGLGEKWSGLEHSDKITKFWNTDVWSDFNPNSYINGKPAPDPTYLSIPYLIIQRKGVYLGLLLDNPGAGFISTGSKITIADQMKVTPEGGRFSEEIIREMSQAENIPHGLIHLGSETGQPNLFIIHGPSLPELTRKLQKLVGTTPLPPAWALGYHQCRWGYESANDLLELDAKFREHGIPADGLWLDIDYMDGYRIFTFNEKHFPNPSETFKKLRQNGRRVIPIIDPGVKFDKKYKVYQRGHGKRAFCLNPQGKEYIGLVWPGETVFPDFSLESTRSWWAGEVSRFAESGLFGAWLDMNDPSTGPSDNQDMLFSHGQKPHSAYHNQYASGMAQATREGFLRAHPNERPFLLCRSGYIGCGRHTAIWTGDNFSNYHHLKGSIATSLNLALSGVPFNGPDAGGFGGDTTPALMRDWYKAGFLFPVFRNHSMLNTRCQEPWAFDARTVTVLRKYIQLRYRLRPYLYQLFVAQELDGDAILRPLFYDFSDTEDLPLGKIEDQFLVGPILMQAPFVEENQVSRSIAMPGDNPWFDVTSGRWLDGGQTIEKKASFADTPVFVRDRTIIPLARVTSQSSAFNAEKADFHIFLSEDGVARCTYYFDDGETFACRNGKRSIAGITATRTGNSIQIDVDLHEGGYGPGEFTFTMSKKITRVRINNRDALRTSPQGVPFCKNGMQTWMESSRHPAGGN